MSLINADARHIPLAPKTVQCVVTSPPYWGLRDYGIDGQLGLEQTPEAYVANMVAVFREVWRVMRNDGTLWLNLGDSYASVHTGGHKSARAVVGANQPGIQEIRQSKAQPDTYGLKEKDLVGIPWRVAFALQADGWYLRSDIIWSKPNPMPESVTDRPTKAHEYLFLLAKSQRYYYDADAVREEFEESGIKRQMYGRNNSWGNTRLADPRDKRDMGKRYEAEALNITRGRNKRTVWTIPTAPYSGAHFATFPPDLVRPCVLAGSKPGDIVLDPFSGSGTVVMVAQEYGRRGVGLELNPKYIDLAMDRTAQARAQMVMPL